MVLNSLASRKALIAMGEINVPITLSVIEGADDGNVSGGGEGKTELQGAFIDTGGEIRKLTQERCTNGKISFYWHVGSFRTVFSV